MKRIFATMNLFFFAQESIEDTDGWKFYAITGCSLIGTIIVHGYLLLQKLS